MGSMNKQYRFCLVKYGEKDKVVIAAAYSVERAFEMVKADYPDWQVSQFWLVWP